MQLLCFVLVILKTYVDLSHFLATFETPFILFDKIDLIWDCCELVIKMEPVEVDKYELKDYVAS